MKRKRLDELKERILRTLQEPPPRGRVWTVNTLCKRIAEPPGLIGWGLRELELQGLIERGVFRSVIRLTEKGREATTEMNRPKEGERA
jgi:DNA-binding HxlR family transcriptional regulator